MPPVFGRLPGFHRGDALRPHTQPTGRKRDDSGLNIVVSEAGFHEFNRQVEDAIRFLTDYTLDVRRLVEFPGVTVVALDFAVALHNSVVQSNYFPAELVQLAGNYGFALELSHYAVSGA